MQNPKKYTRTKVYKNLSTAMTVCFWCNQQKGKVIALDEEWGNEPFAVDYIPCKKCEQRWKHGIVVIETTLTDPRDGRPKITNESWPTGRIYVLTKKGAKKILPEPLYEEVLNHELHIMYAGITAFNKILIKGGCYHGKGPKSFKRDKGNDGEIGRTEIKKEGNQRGDKGSAEGDS